MDPLALFFEMLKDIRPGSERPKDDHHPDVECSHPEVLNVSKQASCSPDRVPDDPSSMESPDSERSQLPPEVVQRPLPP